MERSLREVLPSERQRKRLRRDGSLTNVADQVSGDRKCRQIYYHAVIYSMVGSREALACNSAVKMFWHSHEGEWSTCRLDG